VKIVNRIFITLFTYTSLITSIFAQISFKKHVINSQTHGTGDIYACDLDKDENIDVLAASLEDYQIIYFRNDGGSPLNWTKQVIGSNVIQAHSLYAADFDMDDDLDVIGAAYSGNPGIAMWSNDGGDPLTWSKNAVGFSFINAHEVYAHDLDKDGDMDVLGASSDLHRISWWRNDGGNPIQKEMAIMRSTQ